MKKYISLFIIFCLCFALISCNEARPSDTVTEAPTEKETEKSTLYVYDWEEVGQPSDVEFPFELDSQGKFIVPMGETRIDDLWTYQEFLRTAVLPASFVSAEKLVTIGEFQSFSIINSPSDEYCQKYSYSLHHKGTPITVFVDHEGELPFLQEEYRKLVPEILPPDDFIDGYDKTPFDYVMEINQMHSLSLASSQNCSARDHGHYLYVDNGLAYLYKGDLYYIGLKINGTALYFHFDTWFSNPNPKWKKDFLNTPEYFFRLVGEWDGEW